MDVSIFGEKKILNDATENLAQLDEKATMNTVNNFDFFWRWYAYNASNYRYSLALSFFFYLKLYNGWQMCKPTNTSMDEIYFVRWLMLMSGLHQTAVRASVGDDEMRIQLVLLLEQCSNLTDVSEFSFQYWQL